MDKSACFERNILALTQNPSLNARLNVADITSARYKFQEARNGELVPEWVDTQGIVHPLHSMVDPKREAKRIIDSVESDKFLVLLGLGGAYYAEAALERDDIGMVLVIEYGINNLAGLLNNKDYSRLFKNPRFRLLVDTSGEELKQQILELYQPVLYGGIRVIPLLSRTVFETKLFTQAGSAIEEAIEQLSSDYSVQAHFGTRWFSNIIRNVKAAAENQDSPPVIRKAAISAAGPSLTAQIPRLKEKRKELFLIATDTSLPCLLGEGINPDAVISIDCQHISYYHFMNGFPGGASLFLDLASPPLLSSVSKKRCFFSSGHPLALYVSRALNTLPLLDTSGGNVTYAALSLAEQLGAQEIELYGADFSYPAGITYARGTYVYPFFEKRQNRFSPLEAQASAFMYRNPLEKKNSLKAYWYYETKTMEFYRKKLEEKCACMEASVIPVEGHGAPLKIEQDENKISQRRQGTKEGAANTNKERPSSPLSQAGNISKEFLIHYKIKIGELKDGGKNAADYISSMNNEEKTIFTTLLPTMAALKRRNPQWGFQQLFKETKVYCINEIITIIKQQMDEKY